MDANSSSFLEPSAQPSALGSFFSFLESVATSELETRRQISLAEANAEIMAANGTLYREGQPVTVSVPSWVMPVALLAGVGLVVYLAVK